MNDRIDLHTHSTVSDGTDAPAELVRYAKEKGLRAIALTDHDSIDGIDEALAVGREVGVEVIPGVELSADFSEGAMHLLGLFVDRTAPSFLQRLAVFQAARRERNPKIIKKLQEMGFKITEEEVTAAAGGGQAGRPHFARVLMEKGYVHSITEAFEKYIGDEGPAYVKKSQPSPEECIALIHEANGVAVLAHPNTLRLSDERLDVLFERLVNAGLDGIEVYYSTHTPEETARYERLAAEWNLAKSGGSDFHGKHKPQIDLGVGEGTLHVPSSLLETLRRRKERRPA
ncbi:MAG: PHP domain-containing protein [Candidatus Manganitrophaceae bacterium]|nr:MAG: PHP domain-containing protein [Candidatus Manganitrophaceae bacterium]